MKGAYTLTLTDGTQIPMRFATWSINHFAEKFNLSFSDVIQLFADNKVSINHVIQMLLSGAEYVAKREAKGFHYNDLDAAEWIDDMGGIFSAKMQEVINVIVVSLSSEASENSGEPSEKKLVGESSM